METKQPFSYIKDPRTGKNHQLDSPTGIKLVLRYLANQRPVKKVIQ